jgi:hypothetical protein
MRARTRQLINRPEIIRHDNARYSDTDDRRSCHPLITKTRRLLKRGKPDERHLKYAVGGKTMSVRVSSGAIERALKILEAIILLCESRGWAVTPPDDKSSAEVCIDQDPVSFGISEKISRFQINTDDPDEGTWRYRTDYRYEATGMLTLEILDYLGPGMRRSWSDGKRQRLENVVPEFIAGLATTSEALRIRRLKP